MIDQSKNESNGKKQKSMLDVLLDKWGMDYLQFSKHMGIDYETLRRYRKGERQLRLSWQQIKKLELLLKEANKSFNDLSDDWFRDRD